MFEWILVPLDGSRFGSQALRLASEMAKRFNAEIALMQVVKPAMPLSASIGIAPGTENAIGAELSVGAAIAEDKRNAANAKRYLSRKARELRSKGIKTSYHAVTGEPADAIIKYTRKKKVGMVVMSSHGKGGLKRAIMGSVADKVIRESAKPVLVVHPKKR